MIDCQFMSRSIGKPITSVNRFPYVSLRENSFMTDDNQPLTFGQRVKAARLAAGLKQGPLAKAAGISQPTLSEIESGAYESSTRTPQLASKLGVSALWLAQGKGPRTPEATKQPQAADPSTTPEEQAEQIIEAVKAILRIAKLPEDCLGAPDSLRAALAAKEPLERYSLTEIEETLRGLHQDKPAAFRNAHPDELFSALAGKLRSKGQDYAETEKQPPDPMQVPINR